MDGIHEDTGDCSMQCTEHPFKNNTTPAGGICATCLQEKLGKLVTSSFPITVFPSSSSSSPSFRSNINSTTTTTTTNTTNTVASATVPQQLTNSTTQQITQTNSTNCHHHHQHYSNRSRILYLIGQRKKKKNHHNIIIDRIHECNNNTNNTTNNTTNNNNLTFKRSKSTADGLRYTNTDNDQNPHHKRGFWSFIHLQKHSHSTSSSGNKNIRDISLHTNASISSQQNINEIMVVEDNESPCHASFNRKVSRSRSVGCGSRSFSGDLFERISTGLGDCTLRRVESQREPKAKVSVIRNNSQDCIKDRVKCGGLFSGFMITSSSSSSSSSSYWVASNVKEGGNGNGVTNGKVTSAVGGRERSWGWALASPMRVFSKPASSKREGSNKSQTTNLDAIPSLLSVRS